MEHYVTLFDSFFLPQGLALHMSMERHAGEYTLWILCVDEEANEVLAKLNLANVCLLKLSDFETEELKRVKLSRTKGEYCWTLTPFAPRFVFEANPAVQRVTYLDADGWFRKNPAPVFQCFDASAKYVLITDHAYAPEYDQSAISGQYCVQFMIFTQKGGEVVRKWWEERCLEWCYGRFEDGKFGDQKYLDDWPERFKNLVHVLDRPEWTQAPWNATRYPFSQSIFYHFHGLRIAENRRFDFGPIYVFPKTLIDYVYEPYIRDLTEALKILEKCGFSALPQTKKMSKTKLFRRILSGFSHQFWRFHSLNFRKY
jgi:hypothetical protein